MLRRLLESRKALTLVELIVSIAIISLVSLALLGIVASSLSTQQLAAQRNKASYLAAQELEKKLYSLLPDNSDLSSAGYITTQQHTITFRLNNEDFTCSGLLVQSVEPQTKIQLKGFFPNEEQ